MIETKTIPVTGGCLCGAIRYESTAAPVWVSYCHCRTCQRAYGAIFGLFAAFREETFRYMKGQPKYYRSSGQAKRGFCADCGTPVDFWYGGDPEMGVVNGGAKLVHPGGAKLVHLTLCGTRCWGVVPVVHRRDPRCFV